MMNIAGEFGDDTAIGQSLGSGVSDENKALTEIADMKADEGFRQRLMDETAIGHKEAVIKWQEAHKRAHPTR